MKKRWLMAVTVGLVIWGCDSPESSETGEGDEETAEQEKVADEEVDEQAGEVTVTEEDSRGEVDENGFYIGAHDPSEAVEFEDFQVAMVDSICLAYDNCLNDELRAMIYMTLNMDHMVRQIDGDDRESVQEFQRKMQEIQAQGPKVGTKEECLSLVESMLEGQNINAATIQSAIDEGTVTYDGEQAAECMSRFGQPFDLCTEETEVSPTTSPQESMMGMAPHLEDLEQHFSACEGIFEGILEEGEECRASFECADTECPLEPGESTGECGQPEGALEALEGGHMGAPGGSPPGMGGPPPGMSGH